MSFRFAATHTGPLAKIARSLALPAELDWSSRAHYHVWTLAGVAGETQPPGEPTAFALLRKAAAKKRELFCPRFDVVDDWIPGMAFLAKRRSTLNATASTEVSALWTSLAAPLRTAVTGDIGLDLDLGLRAQARWTAESDCWWWIERPGKTRLLRVRLLASQSSAASLSVRGAAVAGLPQATRNTLAALAGQHRTQLLQRLSHGVAKLPCKLPVPETAVKECIGRWLALPAAIQSEQWQNPADPILAQLKQALEAASVPSLALADQLTARLEAAALRTTEKSLEASLAILFDRQRSSTALLDADFNFAVNPALDPVFQQCRQGDLTPLLARPLAGLTLRACAIQESLSQRRTFAWRLPFTAGAVANGERLHSALEALDNASGRVVHGSAKGESERRTRNAASLLSLEGVFAAHLSPEVAVHDPAALNARFVLELRTRRPLTLQPLLDLYGAGPADPFATACRLEITLAPAAIAHWLQPQDLAAVSRRMQTAWRTLLPAVVDLEGHTAQSLAPLLVWASLPVTTAARRSRDQLELNRPGGSLFWDWADPDLRHAMVWNPRTLQALEARLKQAPFAVRPDQLRRAVAQTVGAAVFTSLLYTEATFIDRLTATLRRAAAPAATPVETMRQLSALLAGLLTAFHGKLTSVYGAEAARALGPLLLCSASAQHPETIVTWTR